MERRTVRCLAEGRGDQWEAICLDFDIAVQGKSFDEVRHSLDQAIKLYLETVSEMPKEDRARLLARRAPFALRLRFFLAELKSLFFDDRGDGGPRERANYIVESPIHAATS